MPTKSYLCVSVNVGATHTAAVLDPITQQVMVKAVWNPSLLDTTLSTMETELQAVYGGDATVDYNVTRFIGVSTTGEAVWAIGVSATDNTATTFSNYMKVMAYSNTTARTITSLNQAQFKKPGENFAQPLILIGFGHETAHFSGYHQGATPPIRIYTASSGGVAAALCDTAAATLPEVPGLVYTTEPYLAFSALSSGNQAGYLARKVSTTWNLVETVAGTSPTLFPLSRIEALVAAEGLVPTYIQSLGSTSELVPLPQCKDANGSFQIDGATLTNLSTSGTTNLQGAFNGIVGGTATVDKTRQIFIYATYPTPAFWQNLVLATEII